MIPLFKMRIETLKIKNSIILILKKLFPIDETNRKVNIGGGNWYWFRWENIDLKARNITPDYRLDISKEKFPFDDNVVDVFFTENVLYYFNVEELEHIMHEIYRCCKKGGLLHIALPFSDYREGLLAYDRLGLYETKFSIESLKKLTESFGFKNFKEVQCRKSQRKELNHFMFDRRLDYLRYFEVNK